MMEMFELMPLQIFNISHSLKFHRYLKSMYPKAEETVILDILAVTENNIQKATEKLIEMGYDKKVMTPAPHLDFTSRKKDNHYHVQEPFMQPTPPPKPKTAEEKKRCEWK